MTQFVSPMEIVLLTLFTTIAIIYGFWWGDPPDGWSPLPWPNKGLLRYADHFIVEYHWEAQVLAELELLFSHDHLTEGQIKILNSSLRPRMHELPPNCSLSALKALWEQRIDKFKELLFDLELHQVRNRHPIPNAVSMTKQHSPSVIVLGMHRFYMHKGEFSRSVAGHELIHVAQEVRESALQREWRGAAFSDVLRWEVEALSKFPAHSIALIACIMALVLLLRYFWVDVVLPHFF